MTPEDEYLAYEEDWHAAKAAAYVAWLVVDADEAKSYEAWLADEPESEPMSYGDFLEAAIDDHRYSEADRRLAEMKENF